MINIYTFNIKEKICENTFNKLLDYVSPRKKNKIMRFKFIEDAKRSLLGDLLVRHAICTQLNLKNYQLEFDMNEYGKPFLVYPKNLFFNISHSGDWVVCAIDKNPVGIDVETIKPIDYSIAKRFFTTKEFSDLMARNSEDRLNYFYKLWTLKESYIKAIGKGLSISLNSFSFSINEEDIILSTEHDSNSYHFVCRQLDTYHMLSLCCYDMKTDIIQSVLLDQIISSL